jgi:hypothetical protein
MKKVCLKFPSLILSKAEESKLFLRPTNEYVKKEEEDSTLSGGSLFEATPSSTSSRSQTLETDATGRSRQVKTEPGMKSGCDDGMYLHQYFLLSYEPSDLSPYAISSTPQHGHFCCVLHAEQVYHKWYSWHRTRPGLATSAAEP